MDADPPAQGVKIARRIHICGCCVAHALLFNGVRLYEETVGRNDVAQVCEEYAASLHEHSLPMPTPNRSSQH